MECVVHGWLPSRHDANLARPDPHDPALLLLGQPVDAAAMGLAWNDPSISLADLLGKAAGDSATARRVAAMSLRILGNREALPAFRRMLADPDEYARKQAAWGLGVLGSREDLDVLRPLLGDPARRVRLFAAFALARLGDADGARLTAEAAQDTSDEPIRRGEAAIALADGRHRQYRPMLEQLLATGGDRLLVSRLQTALGRM